MAQKKVNYPLVGVIMGSTSDWETMREACEVLDELNISYEKRVVSAHRTPEWMSAYAIQAEEWRLQIIIGLTFCIFSNRISKYFSGPGP